MACVTVAEEASKEALSSAAKSRYAADIYALQHRLRRCLQTAAPLLSPIASDMPTSTTATKSAARPAVVARHVRRLAELLREATQLNALLLEEDSGDGGSLATLKHCDTHATAVDAPLQAFYDQQLQVCFCQMRQDMKTAEQLLRGWIAATPELRGLPINCVATTPRQLCLVERDGSVQACDVYSDVLTPAAARLPAPVTHCIESATRASAKEGSSTSKAVLTASAEDQATASKKHTTQTTKSTDGPAAAAPPPTSAEDRIMADIQQAIHQMKDGALQMSAMMAQEKPQMQLATELLSNGVAKTQTNMRELDRVSYVAASTRVPWVLTFIPGMPLLWRTVLQPMWAMVKQVLLMAAILAMTGCVLVLISVVPKPVLFRGQRRMASAVTSTPSPSLPPSKSAPHAGHALPYTTAVSGSEVDITQPPAIPASPSESWWQMNAAEQRKDTETETQGASAEQEITDTKTNVVHTQPNVVDTQPEVVDNQQEVAETQQEVAETQQEVADTRQEVADTRSNVVDTQQEVAETQQEVADNQQEVADNQPEVAETQQEVADNRQEVADTRSNVVDTQEEVADNQPEVVDNQQEVAETQQEVADNRQEVADTRSNVVDNQQEVADNQQEVADTRSNVVDTQQKVAETQQEVADNQQEVADNQPEVVDTQQEVAETQQEVAETQQEVADNQQKVADNQPEVVDNRQEVADTRSNVVDTQQEVADNQPEVVDNQQEVADNQPEVVDNQQEVAETQQEVANNQQEVADAHPKTSDAEPKILDAESTAQPAQFEQEIVGAGSKSVVSESREVDEDL